MGNKNRMPVEFIEFYGGNKKAKLSKEEIERRKASEVKLGGKSFPMPNSVKRDKTAKTKWEYITQLYQKLESELVTNADVDVMEQYCIAYSEWQSLVKMKTDILIDCKKKRFSALSTAKELNASKIDTMINNKSVNVQKLAAKLLLDPISRVKSVPIAPKAVPQTDAEQSGFAV